MKEKKEMQIVVTADDSKAKTSLQKLSDYLKKNFESGAKSTKVTLDTGEAKIKINQLQKEIKELQTFADGLSKQEIASGFYDSQLNRLKEAKTQMQNLKNGLLKADMQASKFKDTMSKTTVEANETSKSIDNLGNKVSSSLDNASKKTRKFVLSLFSVRTAWAVISRASSTYLSENESTTNKVAAAWSYLGNLLGPVIEKIVSWLQYGIAYVNVFVKALTGVDFLAKSIQKTAVKTNKELKKTVSSMDEIVNLDLDSGSNAGVGQANALQDIADLELNPKVVEFLEKVAGALRSVWDWAKTAWEYLKEKFGPVGAGIIVGGLALIIGSAVAGTGLAGIGSLLGAIGIAVGAAFAIKFIYEGLTGRDLIEDLKGIYQGYKDLKDIKEQEKTMNEKIIEDNNKMNGVYDQMIEKIDTVTNNELTQFINSLGNLGESTGEQINRFQDMNSVLNENSDEYKTNAKVIDSAKTNQEKQILALEKIKKRLEDENLTLDENSDKYKENSKLLETTKTNLDKLNGYRANAVVEVDADTRKYETKMGNIFSSIGNFATNLLHGKLSFKNLGYATGGFPEEGQMFIANERGPELIGNIGGSTAVVNNSQIVDSVSQGVASAVAGVLTSQKTTSQNAQYLYINGSEFAKVVYNDIENESLRRNKNTSIRRA